MLESGLCFEVETGHKRSSQTMAMIESRDASNVKECRAEMVSEAAG